MKKSCKQLQDFFVILHIVIPNKGTMTKNKKEETRRPICHWRNCSNSIQRNFCCTIIQTFVKA
jgi:hypothetical protein